MFSLAYPIDDSLNIDGFIAKVDMSFDNILRLLDMLSDENLNEFNKPDIALEMLLSACFFCDYETKVNIYIQVFKEFVLIEEPITESSGKEEKTKQFYSITEDSEYIYASFMQDYGIDLFEQQGALHWRKFMSLLSGLKEDTKFKEVIKIRQWTPSEDTSKEESKNMRELQRIYALKATQEQIEFDSMDLTQKREYALREYEKERLEKEEGDPNI